MLVGGMIGVAGVLALTAGLAWLLAVLSGVTGIGILLWIALPMAGVGVLLALATGYFFVFEDAEIEVREERTFMEQVTSNHAIAGELALGFVLVFPSTIADGLRDLTKTRSIPPADLSAAQSITQALYDKNDWLPVSRYSQDLNTLAALVRLDILWVKEIHGRPHVRLSPSLYN